MERRWRSESPGAFDGRDHDRARGALQKGEIVSPRDIVRAAERDFIGRMLQADLDHRRHRWIYRLKIRAPDGSILKLSYSARDPRLLRARGRGLDKWFKGDPARLAAAAAFPTRRWWKAQGIDAPGPERMGWFRRFWRDGDDDLPSPGDLAPVGGQARE